MIPSTFSSVSFNISRNTVFDFVISWDETYWRWVKKLFGLLVRILNNLKLSFQQFTFADVSTISDKLHKWEIGPFFHFLLTLKSAFDWAEQATALCLCEKTFPNGHGRECFFWLSWIAAILSWLVYLVFGLPLETPVQVYGECFGHDFMVLHHMWRLSLLHVWRLLSLTQGTVVSLSYSVISQLLPWKPLDDKKFLCALNWL